MQKAKERKKEAHIIHDTSPADIIVWAERDGEGEIKTDSERKRQKEERVGMEDSRGEASSIRNSHVIELIGTNAVFHFPSFVAHLDKRILIKWVSPKTSHFIKLQGFNAVMA